MENYPGQMRLPSLNKQITVFPRVSEISLDPVVR